MRALSQLREHLSSDNSSARSIYFRPAFIAVIAILIGCSAVAVGFMLKFPKYGSLQIMSNEPAELWIDGQRQGDAPALLTDLNVGSHRVTLVQPDFLEIQRDVEIRPEEKAKLEVVFPAAGFLQIASDPPGKKVLIAGKTRGTTPLSLKLPVGTHSIEVDGVSRTVVVLEGGEHLEAFP